MTARPIVSALATGALVAAAMTGCSSRPGELTVNAERLLAPKVQQIREIAATGNYDRLARAIDQLKALVEKEKSLGQVSAQRAVAIEDAADTLLNDLTPPPSPSPTQSPTPTPSPTTPSPTPTPTPTPSPTSTPTPSPTSTPTPLISISG